MARILLESYKRGLKLRLTRSNNGYQHDPEYEYLLWAMEDIKKFTNRKLAADKHLKKQYGN